MSRMLVVIRSAPGPKAREAVDVSLAALAYEHDVSILLLGAGVAALQAMPTAQSPPIADLPRALEACRHHGLQRLAVSEACWLDRGLESGLSDVEMLSPAGVVQMIEEHQHVLGF